MKRSNRLRPRRHHDHGSRLRVSGRCASSPAVPGDAPQGGRPADGDRPAPRPAQALTSCAAHFNSSPRSALISPGVLDLYAGTGALGIEALSRGAQWCDFVEKDRDMAEIIRDNLRPPASTTDAVYPITAQRATERLTGGPYTLVLADPPYADPASGPHSRRSRSPNL